jgi:hypothetical protein
MYFSRRYNFRFFLQIIILGLLYGCAPVDEFPSGSEILCDAEIKNKKGDKFVASKQEKVFFDGGWQQSTMEAHGGDHSVMTVAKKSPFAFGHQIKHAGPDWYFEVTVWRKSRDGKGVLVASGKDAKKLYKPSSRVIETDTGGWEKIFLEVYTPPNFNYENLKFYVWNNGSDTVFFDDLLIRRLPRKHYPEYNQSPFAIVIDSSDVLKLEKKRKGAFENGILETTDKDWVKGFVFDAGDPMKVRLRLKGDWLDHLRGDKWSFRIKMRKQYVWNRLRTFSVQTPESRNFLMEWLAHQLYTNRDVLTTRYGFMPLSVNNINRGLYAWEEHFSKQLLEFNNRREGPIIKFTEDAFWQVQKIYIQTEKWQQLPFYEAAVISPFGEARTMRTPALKNQFLNAQKLLYQYKKGVSAPSEIFDLNKLARYYALLELTQARHGMFWHNMRYYYNPVLDRLEPISFDGYSDNSPLNISLEENFLYKLLDMKEAKPEEKLLTDLFFDQAFLADYFRNLEAITEPGFINEFNNAIHDEQQLYDSLLRFEFPDYYFDGQFLEKNAANIREYLPELKKMITERLKDPDMLPGSVELEYSDTMVFQNSPEYFVNVYREETADDSCFIRICNYFPNRITVLGTGESDRFMSAIDINQTRIPAYQGGLEGKEVLMKTDTAARFLFFMFSHRFDTYRVPILPWPHPEGLSARQKLQEETNLAHFPFIRQNDLGELVFEKGEWVVDKPLVIPKGLKVVIDAGTRLDLVNKAMVISYSPVYLRGTEREPVIVTSSDFSGNAFTVLQAEGRSVVEHTVFENLNTLDYEGWTLTGAVTFYESDVDITNTKFYRNRCEDALNIIRSDFLLDRSAMSYTFGDAFDSDFSTGYVTNCTFEQIGNDAIDFSGSDIRIMNVKMTDIGDKGVSGGEESRLIVEQTSIERAVVGLASKDLSMVEVSDCDVRDCDYGIVLLRKKPEYGPATMVLNNTQLINARTSMLIETASRAIVDGKTIMGDASNVGELFY